jgi:hypothetical protein
MFAGLMDMNVDHDGNTTLQDYDDKDSFFTD